MRLVAGLALIVHGVAVLQGGLSIAAAWFHWIEAGAGVLLIAGLWTPIVGTVVAVIEIWNVFSDSGDPWKPILLGTLGAALALLGPGSWSVDARLFGWKRIDFRNGQS
jgi:putative oxidoreductase